MHHLGLGWSKRLVAATIFIVFMIWSFFGALHSPLPRQLPVGVIASGDAIAQIALTLSQEHQGAFWLEAYSSRENAIEAIHRQQIYGAYEPAAGELIIPEAHGPAVGHLLRDGFEPDRITVVNPLPKEDKAGMAPFLLAFGFMIGGILAGIIMCSYPGAIHNRKAVLLRIVGLGAYALILAGLAVALMTLDFGILRHQWFNVWWIGALVIWAHALTILGFRALMGAIGIMLGIIILMLIGVPASGGLLPIEFDPSFWRFVGPYLPIYGGVSAIRNVAYFHATTVAHGVILLLVYCAIGAAVALAVPFREYYRMPRKPPVVPNR